MSKKILVTGSTGFLVKACANELELAGYEVFYGIHNHIPERFYKTVIKLCLQQLKLKIEL